MPAGRFPFWAQVFVAGSYMSTRLVTWKPESTKPPKTKTFPPIAWDEASNRVIGEFCAVCHVLGQGSAAGGTCSFFQLRFATSPPQALESADSRTTYCPGCSAMPVFWIVAQFCQPPELAIVIGPVRSTPLNST